MSAPGSTVTMDEYHAALDRRDKEMMFLVGRIGKLHAALETIATLPMPEQDNMLSANMRKIAADAITPTE